MKYIIALLLTLGINTAQAEAIATMPNNANGKIVLTNEICKFKGKVYDSLRRAYNYTEQGYTSEGCYAIEDETVVVVWDSGNKMRYPAANFTLTNRGKNI